MSNLNRRLKKIDGARGEEGNDEQREQRLQHHQIFAHLVNTGASVGEKAVLVLKARNK